MSRVLVTGGCGFIGAGVVQRLTREGASVVVVDDLSSGVAARLAPEAQLVEASVLNHEVMAREIASADAVVHLAAIASVERCQADPIYSHRVNQGAFVEILTLVRKRDGVPLIYASSAAVYGNHAPSRGISEADRAVPISNYGADKLAMELQARAAFALWGTSSVGLRFFNVFGPGQNPDSSYSGVITRFIGDLTRTGQLTIHGDGQQTRDFVHVDDVVDAVVLALRSGLKGAPVFNVCTGVGTTILDLKAAVEAVGGLTAQVSFAPSRPGDIRRSVGDGRRAAKALGFRPRRSLQDGLSTLFAP